MVKTIIQTVFIFVVVGLIVANTTRNNNLDTANYMRLDAALTGQQLFRFNCAGCHGINKEGILPTFPSLISHRLTKEEIRGQIKNGKG